MGGPRRPAMNRSAGGRPKAGMPMRGGPRIAGTPPDLNGAQRGLGYGGLYNHGGPRPRGLPQTPSFQVPQQFLGGYNQGDTMQQIQRNEYLNTLPVGGQREAAMNQMGYWNGGTPVTPSVNRGDNRFYRDRAQAGGFDSPGIYQQMNADNTGYVGVSNIGDTGSGTYTSFTGPGGGRRIKRRGGTTGGYIY